MDSSAPSQRERITLVSRKDLEISYFRGSGAGGQKRNKTSSGVQILHPESGAIGRASDTRSQEQNKQAAFRRMVDSPKFKFWLARRLHEIRNEETLEETIAQETRNEHLQFEVKNKEGQWTAVTPEYFETTEAKHETN